MASFVNFFKAAFIPSVKAQEDVVNPQEVLKVISKFLIKIKIKTNEFDLEVMCDFMRIRANSIFISH